MTCGWLLNAPSRLNVAILISVICHAVLLFGITFKFPLPLPEDSKFSNPIEVILVNSKSAAKPNKADTPVQVNPAGVGNSISGRQAKVPVTLAPKHDETADNTVLTQKTEQIEQEAPLEQEVPLEQEAQPLMADSNSDQSFYQAELPLAQPEQSQKVINASELIQRGFQIARLEAQTAWGYETHQKPPKRKFVGARTREYRFARYVEDWRIKVERIGNLNYPEAARREGLYGNLKLTVGIRSDGSLESIEMNRPSGKKILDEAAIRIVKLAGQNGFAPFPPDISQDTDVLHITRTWVFTRSDQLASE